jgi:hypothetical protein
MIRKSVQRFSKKILPNHKEPNRDDASTKSHRASSGDVDRAAPKFRDAVAASNLAPSNQLRPPA